jgi:hypothetical protein
MKLDAHLRPAARRLSAFGAAVLLACLMAIGASDAVTRATASTPLTQAQKLSRALNACKKQPRGRQAACRKRAKSKYPVAPPGPTLAWLRQQLCASPPCGADNVISNLTIFVRGTPRLGTGISAQRGGDDVPSNTWIYPLKYRYDQATHMICYVASSYCTGNLGGVQPTYYTETTHWRVKANALRDAAGHWLLRGVAFSTTCDPEPAACRYTDAGGPV